MLILTYIEFSQIHHLIILKGAQMANETLKKLKENNVKFLQLQFVDIFGIPKHVEVPESQFEKAINGEIGFDGSSIEGFTRIEESDMELKPDFSTFSIWPWESPEGKIARIICDVYMPDGTPFEGCPRLALKKMIEYGKKMGFDLMVGPEAEFFLFKRKPNGEITTETHDAGAYFDMAPYDEGESARREVVQHLINLGLEIEAAHHEVANGQHEIDFKYEPALRAADNIMTLKFVVKRIAQKYNLHASFMPKPIEGINGSGMHCHMSLMKNDVNLFYDKNSEFELSPLCKHFIAGILKHAKGFSAITNPIINSYKRLIPGFEAPVNIAWSEKNRSPLVRIPAKRGRGTRIEVRVPDTAANPYLAMLTMFAAGLDGVKEKLDPPSPVNKNIFIMSSREKKRLKIEAIPESLDKALDEMKKDKIICDALGNHIASHIYITRKNEWRKYISKVHEWEIKTYLPIY